MQPPTFGTTDAGITPWLPPTVNGGRASDATASLLGLVHPAGYPDQQSQMSTAGAPQAQPQDKGNWLTRLLPTGGGMAGTAGGAALGTAILPGIGTVLGGILGAGLGSAGAKAGENAIEGQGIGNDVIREGLMGAGGQAVGGVLGKIGGSLAVKGSKMAARGATKLIQGQAAKGTLDNQTADTLRQMGVTNLNQVSDIAPHITGSTGALSKGVQRGLQETNTGVDITGLDDIARNVLAENGASPQAIEAAGYNLTSATNNMLPGDVIKTTGKVGGKPTYVYNPGALKNALPENVFGQTQKMESLANEASTKAFDRMGNVVNSDEYAKYKAYKEVAGELRTRAFGGDTPLPLSDANKTEIIQGLAPLKDINPSAYDYHVQQVTNAQNLQDLRPLQAPLVNADKAVNATARMEDTGSTVGNMAKSVLPVAGGAAAGVPGMVAGAAPMLLGSNAADRAGAAVLAKLGSAGVQKNAAKVIAPALMGTSQFLSHAPNYVPGQTSAPIGGAMDNQGGQPQQMGQPGAGGVSPNEQMLQMALVGMQNPLYASTFAPIVESLMKGPIQQATSANTALEGAQSAFGAAGGGQGLLGGLLGKLGGAVTGGPAQAYDAQRQQLIAQLTALGIPTSAVPQITNTPEAAATQWQTLQNLINAQGAGTGSSLLAGVR